MKGPARNFFTLAVIFAILGLLLGLQMAMSADHGQRVTHAHVMLAGWVSLAIFAFFYHAFPGINAKGIASVHFWLQAAASVVMLGSLLLFYGGSAAAEPGAAIGAIAYGIGVLLFAYISLPALWKS